MAIKATGEEVQFAQVVTSPLAETQMAMNSTKTLPRTASPAPLIALIGLLALGGALTLRVVEKRLQ